MLIRSMFNAKLNKIFEVNADIRADKSLRLYLNDLLRDSRAFQYINPSPANVENMVRS